jgi:hypothetical protein
VVPYGNCFFKAAEADLAAGGYAPGAPMGSFQIYEIIGRGTPCNILSRGDTLAA